MDNTENMETLLKNYPLFEGESKEHIEMVAKMAQLKAFEADTLICHEGQAANAFFLIVYGRAAIELSAPGKGDLIVQTLGPGDIVGWSGFFEPHRWRFDVRAITDVNLLRFESKAIQKYCEADFEFGYFFARRIASVLNERLEATRLQLLDIYGNQKDEVE